MKRIILNSLMAVLACLGVMAGIFVCDYTYSVRQSRALQSSFEREIQRLEESGKCYAVTYDGEGAIGGIFTFKDANDRDEWVNANFERMENE